jgi:hypothetical protein
MKKAKLLFILFVFLLSASGLFASPGNPNDFEKNFKILPKPQKVELLTGKALSYDGLKLLYLEGAMQRPVLDEPLSSLSLASSKGKSVLSLVLTQDNNLPSSSEGYILEIKDAQVIISSRGEAGLFYGCQTLLQLLEDARDQQITIPACKITDYPEIAYRAVHWDLKYHLDHEIYYYRVIDRLARIKVNAIMVEFEDKLRYRRAPMVGASNAISIEEFTAICRYAKERHIEISPLVQGLGHASFILKHDEYKDLRDDPQSDYVFDPLNPKTYDLQFAMYEDAIDATPGSKYLHVGGDEVYNLGQSELCKKSGKKPFELQLYWLNKVCEFARQHNRIPVFWDDMIFSLSGLLGTIHEAVNMPKEESEKLWKENEHKLNEYIGLFPKDCIYMRWTYWNVKTYGNIQAIDWFKSHGLKVMAATGAQTMSAMLPRNNSMFQPIKEFCGITAEKKLEGILCTTWDDSSPHFETFWRGLYDFGSMSWHYEDITADEAHTLFRHRFYAAALSGPSFEFQDLLEQALTFWGTALCKEQWSNKERSTEYIGDRKQYPKKMDLVELPDPLKTGAWSEANRNRIEQAAKEVSRYAVIKEKIEKNEAIAKRNHYSLALLKQINEVQVYPSKLLLLLDKYDKTTSVTGKSAARLQIKNYVDSFSEIRKNYEDVFSQTRFLNNPVDYKLDQNPNSMLADATNNSDWMYVYELAMNNKIKNWLEN